MVARLQLGRDLRFAAAEGGLCGEEVVADP